MLLLKGPEKQTFLIEKSMKMWGFKLGPFDP